MKLVKPPSYKIMIEHCHPLARGLQMYWLINEQTGKSLFDASRHGNDGTITGASWSEGMLNFDGIDDCISGIFISSLSNWTLYVDWIPGVVTGTRCIVDNGSILLYQFEDDLVYGFVDSGGVERIDTASSVLTSGQRASIAVTKSGNTITLYINGIQKDSFADSNTLGSESAIHAGRRTSLAYANMNGSSQYFYRSNADFPESAIVGDMTIQAWIRVNALNTRKTIVAKWDNYWDRSYIFRVDNTNELILLISGDGHNASYRYSTNLNLSTGTWMHVAVTYDASAGSCIFYKNGVTLTDDSAALLTNIAAKSSPFTVGFGNTLSSPTDYMNGSVDNICLFNDIRTPDEITASAANRNEDCSDEGNIIGQWMFNETADATAIDNNQGNANRDLIPYNGGNTTFGNCGQTRDFAKGKLDNMAVWNRALSANEIRWYNREPYAIMK